MGTLKTLLQYILQSEPLIVVTLTLAVAGLALFADERWQVFDLHGLPEWARPTALIVWTLCAVHVAIRTIMYLSNRATAAGRFIATIPQRRRRADYEQPIIERLRATDGVEREVLCYALYRDNDRFWIPGARRPRWLQRLIANGLVGQSGTGIQDTQFRIHHVAWAHMQKYPDKFQNLVGWDTDPWRLDDDVIENRMRKQTVVRPRS
jgi:hypothetical protein